VYLVDNGSDDATVERAIDAGAIPARRFDTDGFDEERRMSEMQAVADEVSADEAANRVWWLFLDADEFYGGPDGLTLREFLAALDRRYRVVGAHILNHLPTAEPAYVRGKQPLDFQPLSYRVPAPWWCDHGHWRHALLRFDRDAAPIRIGRSFHVAHCEERLFESEQAVVFHHFPYRERETTRRRLERLLGLTSGADRSRSADAAGYAATEHYRRRLAALEAVYEQRYEDADIYLHPPGARPDLRNVGAWLADGSAR
jgi:hypothetical protein